MKYITSVWEQHTRIPMKIAKKHRMGEKARKCSGEGTLT
jgi:hypothetical protein